MPFRIDHLRPSDTVRIRNERWRVTRRVPYGDVALVEVVGVDAANRGTSATFLLPFEPLEALAATHTPRVVRPARWRRIARAALADATPTPHALRTAARARMAVVPFQLEPALAVTSGRACRLLIADEVGLGKTVQAGLIVAEVFAREPDARTLIVCPAAVREQWRSELASRFALTASVLDASAAARVATGHGANANPWASARLAIASIDYVKRPEVLRAFDALLWDVIVFDEAHSLSGASDRGAATAALASRGRRVVLLTATPHSGDEDAYRRLCAIGRLENDPPLIVFRRNRADAGISSVRRTRMLRVRPSRLETAMHNALLAYARRVWGRQSGAASGARLAMTVLMRRAWSSAASLARSVERRLSLLAGQPHGVAQLTLPLFEPDGDDDEPSGILAVPGLADPAEETKTLERLLALARRAEGAESKVAALVRLVRRAREPVLVFTEYRDTLAHVAVHLPVGAISLHGGMTARERLHATRQFTDGSAPVLLATDAASEGLNLHHRCRLVVTLELPWTPLRLEQRVGRVDRIGQAKPVHAVHLVARDTGEESIVARLATREARARASLEEIGEAVLHGGSFTSAIPADVGVASHDVVCIDLRREARAEAERIERARLLLPEDTAMPARPTVCVLRRRSDRAFNRLWVWRVTFASERGRVLWESLLPLAANGPRAHATRAWARACLGVDDPLLIAAIAKAERARLAILAESMATDLRLLTRRERAIRRALEAGQARLAGSLLQPGLFDRRAERAMNAQSALVHEALSHAAARIAELEATARPLIDERRLLFAIALGRHG